MTTSIEIGPNGVDCRVPAECTLATKEGQWSGADLRRYDFHGQRTHVPPLRDLAVITYHSRADIALQCGRISDQNQMRPWDLSILRPGLESRWRWASSFKATVIYLSERKLAAVAEEVFDRDIKSVSINESFRLKDWVIRNAVISLTSELDSDNLGGPLYSDCIVTQLCVHLLRHYASVELRLPRCTGALNPRQSRLVSEYVEDNLAGDLSLQTLASVAEISAYHFARLFKKRFGTPPHAYVQQKRLEKARKLILHSDMALKEIVAASGFYDQSHMTHSFKRHYATTPTGMRKGVA